MGKTGNLGDSLATFPAGRPSQGLLWPWWELSWTWPLIVGRGRWCSHGCIKWGPWPAFGCLWLRPSKTCLPRCGDLVERDPCPPSTHAADGNSN